MATSAFTGGRIPFGGSIPSATNPSGPGTTTPSTIAAPTQPINYARPAASGWTGSSIGPSYSVLNGILGPASTGSSVGGANVPPAVAPNFAPFSPAGGGGGGSPFGGVPPVGPLTGGGGGGGGGMYPGPTDPLGTPLNLGRGTILTPEQAYAQYLATRGWADTTTPQQNMLSQVFTKDFNYGYNPTGRVNVNPTASGGWFGGPTAGGYVPFSQVQQDRNTMNLALAPTASRYAYSYGAPAAAPPAPTPAWGYPSQYGQPAPGMQPPPTYQPMQSPAMPRY